MEFSPEVQLSGLEYDVLPKEDISTPAQLLDVKFAEHLEPLKEGMEDFQKLVQKTDEHYKTRCGKLSNTRKRK